MLKSFLKVQRRDLQWLKSNKNEAEITLNGSLELWMMVEMFTKTNRINKAIKTNRMDAQISLNVYCWIKSKCFYRDIFLFSFVSAEMPWKNFSVMIPGMCFINCVILQ